MKNLVKVMLLLFLLFMISCTPGTNTMTDAANAEGDIAGFWLGIWHGFTLMFTFIISWFTDSVNIYEIHNSGFWYNFGFLFGVMCFFGGSGGGACKKYKRR